MLTQRGSLLRAGTSMNRPGLGKEPLMPVTLYRRWAMDSEKLSGHAKCSPSQWAAGTSALRIYSRFAGVQVKAQPDGISSEHFRDNSTCILSSFETALY